MPVVIPYFGPCPADIEMLEHFEVAFDYNQWQNQPRQITFDVPGVFNPGRFWQFNAAQLSPTNYVVAQHAGIFGVGNYALAIKTSAHDFQQLALSQDQLNQIVSAPPSPVEGDLATINSVPLSADRGLLMLAPENIDPCPCNPVDAGGVTFQIVVGSNTAGATFTDFQAWQMPQVVRLKVIGQLID